MKNIIIIGTYPNEDYKVDMLKECIRRIKPLGYEIMVVSHYPIPFEVQKEVEYVLYDKTNTITRSELVPNWNFVSDTFMVTKISLGGHILAVTKNIYNGVNYAKNLGFEFFFYMEYDNLLNSEDLFKIETLRYSMYSEQKKMIFFNYPHQGHEIYETLMFGGKVHYFQQNNVLPMCETDLNNERVSLERLFYLKHKQNENLFYLVPTLSKDFFSKSDINKEFEKYVVELFVSNKEPYSHLFMMNLKQNPNKIQIKINDEDLKELETGVWSYRNIPMGVELVVKIYIEEREIVKNFKLTEENKKEYLDRGFMFFKNK